MSELNGFPTDDTVLLPPGEAARVRAKPYKPAPPANGTDDIWEWLESIRFDQTATADALGTVAGQIVSRFYPRYNRDEIVRTLDFAFREWCELSVPASKIGAAIDRAIEGGGKPSAPAAKRFKFFDSNQLTAGDFRPEWLVKGAVVKGQPGIIAGPSKAMKTNTAIDLAVSMASGKPFLGQFAVPKPLTVAVVSGESGAATIQETFSRVCKAKNVSPKLGDMLRWCFDVPLLSDLDAVDELVAELSIYGTDAAILDPLYLMLGDIDAKNLFEMGSRLRIISDLFVKADITPMIVHHANKQLKVGEPMELADLAYSGLEQFGRQFVLLNRRTRYADDGSHDLWLRVGGSAGHGGLWNVRIEEGLTDEKFSGRTWNVVVQSLTEAKATLAKQKAEEKQKTADEKREADRNEVLRVIDLEAEAGRDGATKTIIRVRSGFGSQKLDPLLAELVEFGHIEPCEVEKATGNGAKGKFPGYRRAVFDPTRANQPDLMTGVEETGTTVPDPPTEEATKKVKKAKRKQVDK